MPARGNLRTTSTGGASLRRLLLAPLAVLLQRVAMRFPGAVERFYARGLFPLIGRALNTLTGWIPFSLAELTVWALVLAGTVWVFHTLLSVAGASRGGRLTTLWRRAAGLLVLLASVYFWFIVLWGLNYARQPFATIAGLVVRPSSTAELGELCADLIDRANALRLSVKEDANGIMRLNGSIPDALRRAQLGYLRAAEVLPVLDGRYGRPKGVVSSRLWSYTGIAGAYFPFTGEANVNTAMPASSIPHTACHEMAHQRGFAREDEANYIAYLACRLHPDPDFQYSGTLAAVTEAMYQLRQRDPARYAELVKRLSDGVRRDLRNEYDFWHRYEGPVADISERMNDRYLKSNGQTDGVQSYGRMVDLLLAEYRQRKVNETSRPSRSRLGAAR